MKSLKRYCNTDNQRAVVDAYLSNDCSTYKAAAALGKSPGTVYNIIQRLSLKANRELRPEEKQTIATDGAVESKISPIGQVYGTSTLYDGDGNVKQIWVKESHKVDAAKVAIEKMVQEFKAEIPKATPAMVAVSPASENATMITITDYHLGMFAHEDEAGVEWTTDKAYKELIDVSSRITSSIEPCKTIILNIMGDFLHSDSISPVTPTSHHVLSSDSRFHKMIKLGVRAIKYLVSESLQKADKVILAISEGNHDLSSSKWMQALFDAYYEDEHRVEVIVNPTPFICINYGKTMIVIHHGHRLNPEQIAVRTASIYPKEWGDTQYRYAHLGHRHHKTIKETCGIIVEQHQTYSPKDDYSSSHGYIAERGINVITYSPEYGEVSRSTFRPL